MKDLKAEKIIGLIILVIVVAGLFFVLTSTDSNKKESTKIMGGSYKEIVDPAGFVNIDEIKIADLVGKKIILVDFLTYSCINCQRTFPYLVSWYDEYKDQGLEIVGIHTPEFAFEKDINNVREAMEKFGIKYPIVLDNNYATWRNYGNKYWPRKYLIDIHGNIVYDHIGEGDYEETEKKIQELLKERAEFLGLENEVDLNNLVSEKISPDTANRSISPETYFGSLRNEFLGNGKKNATGEQEFILPQDLSLNSLYLGGKWDIQNEYAKTVSDSSFVYKYRAKDVYLVARSDSEAIIEVYQDGQLLNEFSGDDINNGILKISESQLYKIVSNHKVDEHVLEFRFIKGEAEVYTFTFG